MALLTAKTLAIFFALATAAFCVSTIVLAVQKSELEDELQDVLNKLDTISTVVTPSTTGATQPSSTQSSSSTMENSESSSTSSSSLAPPGPTASSEFPWPTLTVPVVDPNLPTLPPTLPKPEEIVYRLPSDVRPIKYNWYIHPDLKTNTCEGTVSIQIEVDVQTNLIVMHARELDVEGISILNMMGRMRIRIKKFYLAPEREMLFIELDELLFTATPYVVSISYHCQLGGLSGAYSSSYLDTDGKNSSFG